MDHDPLDWASGIDPTAPGPGKSGIASAVLASVLTIVLGFGAVIIAERSPRSANVASTSRRPASPNIASASRPAGRPLSSGRTRQRVAAPAPDTTLAPVVKAETAVAVAPTAAMPPTSAASVSARPLLAAPTKAVSLPGGDDGGSGSFGGDDGAASPGGSESDD